MHRNLHFKQVSEVVGVPLEEIKYLNPKYYNDIVPGSGGTCTLILPEKWTDAYIDAAADTLYTHKASEYLSEKVIRDISEGKASGGSSKTCYVVKSGDTLSHIARR